MLAEQRWRPIGFCVVSRKMERRTDKAKRAAGRMVDGLDQPKGCHLRVGQDPVDGIDWTAGHFCLLQQFDPVICNLLLQPLADQLLDLRAARNTLVIVRVGRMTRQLRMSDDHTKALPLAIVTDLPRSVTL